jgi:hypothetical protein
MTGPTDPAPAIAIPDSVRKRDSFFLRAPP